MKFTIKKKLDNWNKIIGYARANRYLANEKKQNEMDIIKEFLPKEKVKNYPIKMIFKWHIKSKISDLDNKSTKSILCQPIEILFNCKLFLQEVDYD